MATVRRDFFLDPADRLTEQERALMTAMLTDLLGGIATEIRASLPNGWAAANDEDGQKLVRQLGSAGLINQAELIAILLRRADEERIANALRARSTARPAFLQAMISDPSVEISGAAMSLILTRGKRHDRIGQPRIDFDDLSRRLAESLAYAVAAALRSGTASPPRAAEMDDRMAAAVKALMDRHDGSKATDAVTSALARVLIDSGSMDEGLLAAAAEEGDVAFLSEALAEMAEIPGAAAWDYLLDGRGSGFICLLRMADVSRQLAARLLASLADLIGITDPGAELASFEKIEEAEAGRSRQWLRLDPQYRIALEALGHGNGHRTV